MKSRKLQEFTKEIQFVNRNPKDNSVLKLLDDVSTNPEMEIDAGEYLFRSRIIEDKASANKEAGFYGYGEKDSFIPPWRNTKDMRANYRYIPYLYCTNDKYLSIIEVRPRFGAEVSVAKILVKSKLALLDFTMRQIPKGMNEVKQNLFHDLSELFSTPVAKDDDVLDYIPTQYIAEYAKNIGYGGIAFKSSLYQDVALTGLSAGPFNIVIFEYEKCAPIASNIYKIVDNYMECEQTDEDSNREEILSPVGRALNRISGG